MHCSVQIGSAEGCPVWGQYCARALARHGDIYNADVILLVCPRSICCGGHVAGLLREAMIGSAGTGSWSWMALSVGIAAQCMNLTTK